jgi:hypothetical protein
MDTAEIRLKLPEGLRPLLCAELQRFENYTEEFLKNDDGQSRLYLLKKEHSLAVFDNALEIAAKEPALRHSLEEAERILLLSALYHDAGRFTQIKLYRTFNDARSVNHARLGAALLSEPRFLTEESRKNRRLIRLAVLLHNRAALPGRLHPSCKPVCAALRDADKLDILRVLRAELARAEPDPTVLLGLKDEPGAYSEKVLETVLRKSQVAYRDLYYVNDFRMLLCSWLYALVFETSRAVLARGGLLEEIMDGLPQNRRIKLLRKNVLQDLGKSTY